MSPQLPNFGASDSWIWHTASKCGRRTYTHSHLLIKKLQLLLYIILAGMVILQLTLPSTRVNIVSETHDELGNRKIICRFEQMGNTQGGVLDVRRVEECAGVISKLLGKQKVKDISSESFVTGTRVMEPVFQIFRGGLQLIARSYRVPFWISHNISVLTTVFATPSSWTDLMHCAHLLLTMLIAIYYYLPSPKGVSRLDTQGQKSSCNTIHLSRNDTLRKSILCLPPHGDATWGVQTSRRMIGQPTIHKLSHEICVSYHTRERMLSGWATQSKVLNFNRSEVRKRKLRRGEEVRHACFYTINRYASICINVSHSHRSCASGSLKNIYGSCKSKWRGEGHILPFESPVVLHCGALDPQEECRFKNPAQKSQCRPRPGHRKQKLEANGERSGSSESLIYVSCKSTWKRGGHILPLESPVVLHCGALEPHEQISTRRAFRILREFVVWTKMTIIYILSCSEIGPIIRSQGRVPVEQRNLEKVYNCNKINPSWDKLNGKYKAFIENRERVGTTNSLTRLVAKFARGLQIILPQML
ncbi:hypothetical protein VP01_3115g1 [Puccinia sorghi]|uniref:Uncharacterized protein n=1 Tax=Puccinia sorghi TaxID=27349 RepID=A0A0L6UZH5_9BASI|nr:hypothetical protein VP01_3115g1 [Puccinia sorghi]